MTRTRTTSLVPPGTTSLASWSQSLADGAPGITLLHIARVHAGIAGWEPVHRLALAMTSKPVHAHPETTNLFRGAPAVAYALHTAGHPAYRTALVTLDHHIDALIRLRLQAAHRRIDAGQLARADEYDLINGLTGLGAYLLHRHHDHELLREVLTYLVRLTQPIRAQDQTLPGWWATGSPDRRREPRWNGGHCGFGMAHGIAGPLALLSAAMRRGITVHGHDDAIGAICAWCDRWQTGRGRQTWWPEVITRNDLHIGAVPRPGPHRPSWCYGTPGIARAQQQAAIALGDSARARTAEQALIGCLTDERQLAHLADAGLCHGWAGLVHTARRAAADAGTGELATAANGATVRMRQHTHAADTPADHGLLEGGAGVALVDTTTNRAAPARTWDTCLLVS